jgi:hypothetical protein
MSSAHRSTPSSLRPTAGAFDDVTKSLDGHRFLAVVEAALAASEPRGPVEQPPS